MSAIAAGQSPLPRITLSRDNHHDSLFRLAFSRPEQARVHFEAALPDVVAQAADWETLEARSETFVDPQLKNLQSDILYRVRLVGGGELYLYVLLEHQNKRDYLMPFRLLQYMVRIWERWLQESKGKRPLPFIFPMVLYNGQRRWPVPLQFQEMFHPDLRAPLSAYLPAFVYDLQDLSETPDEELTGEALRQMVLLLLKWGKSEDFWQRFPDWLTTMREIYDQPHNGLRAIEALLRYIVKVVPDPPPQEIYSLLSTELSSTAEELLMTWAEQLEQKGLQRGLQRGLEEGLERGLERGRAEEQARQLQRSRLRFLKLLALKFQEVPPSAQVRVEEAAEEELDRWTEVILMADTIEAIFQG